MSIKNPYRPRTATDTLGRRSIPLVLILSAFLAPNTSARRDEPKPLDGPHNPVRDDFLDKLAGQWELTGKVGSRPVRLHVSG